MQTAVAYEKISEIPKPNGDLVDYHGDTLSHGRDSLMVRLNTKTSEEVTFTKGMLALLGIGVATVGVVVGILFYIVVGAMGYQKDVSRIDGLEGRVTKIEDVVMGMPATTMAMQKDLEAIKDKHEARDKEIEAITTKLGNMDQNIGDIRILLAQQALK